MLCSLEPFLSVGQLVGMGPSLPMLLKRRRFADAVAAFPTSRAQVGDAASTTRPAHYLIDAMTGVWGSLGALRENQIAGCGTAAVTELMRSVGYEGMMRGGLCSLAQDLAVTLCTRSASSLNQCRDAAAAVMCGFFATIPTKQNGKMVQRDQQPVLVADRMVARWPKFDRDLFCRCLAPEDEDMRWCPMAIPCLNCFRLCACGTNAYSVDQSSDVPRVSLLYFNTICVTRLHKIVQRKNSNRCSGLMLRQLKRSNPSSLLLISRRLS